MKLKSVTRSVDYQIIRSTYSQPVPKKKTFISN